MKTPSPVLRGDVIWFEPGDQHWHGAAPTQLTTHQAVQRTDADGKAATWREPVSDTEYSG